MITARFLPPTTGRPTAPAATAAAAAPPPPPPPFSNRTSGSSPTTSSCSILSRYQMGNTIGEGSFGIVYRAMDKKSGALVR
jgi:hypothetical protein